MVIEVGFPGGSRVDASFADHVVRTDQPAPWGEGSSPTPFEVFQASLATCAGIYVLSFCRERGIPTEGLKLLQRSERDPGTGMLTRIDLEIRLPEGFPEKYRQAVVRSAEQCAVKRLLEQPPRFTTTTVTGVPAETPEPRDGNQGDGSGASRGAAG